MRAGLTLDLRIPFHGISIIFSIFQLLDNWTVGGSWRCMGDFQWGDPGHPTMTRLAVAVV